MITIKQKGNFAETDAFLKKVSKMDVLSILNRYGARGVSALRSNTPTDTGLTANSWTYEIAQTSSGYRIYWKNSNIVNGVPIAIILQYGHGTGTGGYVEGRDYINPALRPIFDEIAESAWKEITSA